MATNINGLIAKEDDNTSWISKTEWDAFSLMVRTSGSLIIGHRTYDILTKQPEFAEFEKVKLVVVSNKKFKTLSSNHLIAKSPKQAIELLQEFKTIIVAGGGILNSAFLKEKLIDEIYLDIEPCTFGKGIKLFKNENFEANLKLLETKRLSDDEIQLHYKVLK